MRGGRLFTIILFCLMLIFSRADIMFGDPPGDPGNLDALVGDIDEGPPEIFEYRGNGSPLKVKIIQNGASLEVEDYDSAIIRTTLESGEFPITVIYDKDLVDSNWQSPFGPSFVHDPGSLCGTWGGDKFEGTLYWDFADTQSRFLFGELNFVSKSTLATTDFKVAVARPEDFDYSLEFWGFPDVDEIQDWIEGKVDIEPFYLGSYVGPDLSGDVNIGTILMVPGEYGHLAVINRGRKELILDEVNSDVTRVFENIFNPDFSSLILADLDVPVLVEGYDDTFLTPATAHLLETDFPVSMHYPDPIEIKYDDSTLRLLYNWAVSIVDEENFEVGIIQRVESRDVVGTSTVIDTLLDYGAIYVYVDPDRDFDIFYAPDIDGIVRITVDTPNPEYDGEKICGLPLLVQFSFPGNLIDTYNSGLAEELELKLPANPTDEEIIQVMKEALYLEKDWGTVQENISLDNDAVNVWVEERDVVYLCFRLHILLVDGGSAGDWENISIGGQSYLVIYDGDNNGEFVDPLSLRDISDGSSSQAEIGGGRDEGGSDGCSLGLISPLFLLLLLPLLSIIKR